MNVERHGHDCENVAITVQILDLQWHLDNPACVSGVQKFLCLAPTTEAGETAGIICGHQMTPSDCQQVNSELKKALEMKNWLRKVEERSWSVLNEVHQNKQVMYLTTEGSVNMAFSFN